MMNTTLMIDNLIENNLGELFNTLGLTKELKEVIEYNNTYIEEVKDAVTNLVYSTLVNKPVQYRNASGEVCCTSCYNWMASMILNTKLKNKEVDPRTCLLDTDFRVTTIDGELFYNIDYDVGAYLEKNCPFTCAAFMVNSGTNKKLAGNSVVIYKKYFKTANKIYNAKRMLAVDGKIDDLDIEDSNFELQYIENKVCQGKQYSYRKLLEISGITNEEILCKKHNISFPDYYFRIMTGMNKNEALELGEQEKDKYGLHYKMTNKDMRIFYHTLIREIIAEEKESESR